jgi:hypothetical protein
VTTSSDALAIGALALAAAAVQSAAVAQNADPHAKAQFLNPIEVAGKKATLNVRYRCASGEALWVPAKQVSSRREGQAAQEGGLIQGLRGVVAEPPQPLRVQRQVLRDGRAWDQFCVTQGDETLILSTSGWVKVK